MHVQVSNPLPLRFPHSSLEGCLIHKISPNFYCRIALEVLYFDALKTFQVRKAGPLGGGREEDAPIYAAGQSPIPSCISHRLP